MGYRITLDRLGELADGLHRDLGRLVDAALEVHRVGSGGDVPDALSVDGLGEDGRGGGAVTGHVGGLRSDLADHLRAHVLEPVGELDLLGYGHTVLGDGRRTELLLEHDVAALGAKSNLDCVGELVDARQHLAAGLLAIDDLFSCHFGLLPTSR
jgi:hypothetical protein